MRSLGSDAGGLDLLVDVADQVAGGPGVEAALARAAATAASRGVDAELAGERADRLAELGRAAEGVALPERQPARDARARA